jgi:hypothetical protein
MADFWPVFVLASAIFGTVVAAMAVGVMFKRPCLRGSCGGTPVLGPDGNKLSCETCPNRKRTQADGAAAVIAPATPNRR